MDVSGTSFDDVLDASKGVTNGNDSIYGYGGDDTLFGLGGDDILVGAEGADHLDGGDNVDLAIYSASPAEVTVSLATGAGWGGDAEGDTLVRVERLMGSDHNDVLVGNGSANGLQGNDGNDLLKGGGGTDNLWGVDDNDTLKGGGGADNLFGGFGVDTAAYNESPAAVTVSLLTNGGSGGDAAGDTLDGIENLTGSAHSDTLRGNYDNNVLTGLDGDDTLKGFGGADTLWGGPGNDSLFGLDDHGDTLRGEAGNDYLDGGAGADDMIGSIGNDTYIVDNAGDDVNEAVGEGNDIARASVSWTMTAGASIETLQTIDETDTAAINLTGNNIGNHVIGNDGDNVLNGGGGIDQMTGHGGNDTYYVDNAIDWVTESGGGGDDEVRTTVSWTLTAGADVETLRTTNDAGMGAINLTGNSSNNSIIGNNAANVIAGRDGNDELTGNGGADSFLFNTALNAATNLDVITDFNVADDTIQLDDDIFSSSLGLGNISAGEFVIGAAALDANDRIIYNGATGALFYDSDGVGGTAQIQFATLSTGLALTNLDFLVVA